MKTFVRVEIHVWIVNFCTNEDPGVARNNTPGFHPRMLLRADVFQKHLNYNLAYITGV